MTKTCAMRDKFYAHIFHINIFLYRVMEDSKGRRSVFLKRAEKIINLLQDGNFK